MRIMAYDLARTVGWAFADGRERPEYGTFTLPRTEGRYGRYLRRFAEIATSQIEALRPDYIIYECPILPRKTRIDILRALYCQGPRLEEIADVRGIEIKEGDLGPIRSHFLGAGNCPRGSDDIADAIDFECRRRGWQPQDHNAADALALLDFARACRIPGWANEGLTLLGGAAGG